MRVLVTGAAGFIGYHVARALMARGDSVTGFDVVNDYYDPALKEARLAELAAASAAGPGAFAFVRADLADRAAVEAEAARMGARVAFSRVSSAQDPQVHDPLRLAVAIDEAMTH